MTRINVGIDPRTLSTKMLIAEHREIKRIPNAVRSGRAIIKDIPDTFRLGAGHVKFFYTRLGYLLNRYVTVRDECLKRGYKVQDYSNAWTGIPQEYMGWYNPTPADRKIVEQRIKSKQK